MPQVRALIGYDSDSLVKVCFVAVFTMVHLFPQLPVPDMVERSSGDHSGNDVFCTGTQVVETTMISSGTIFVFAVI